MIAADQLSKRFHDHVAIDGLSFAIERGEIVGLLGPNGAGKTTTMRILAGYLPASAGRASVAGVDVSARPRHVQRRIGYLPESPPVYPDLTVAEYLRFIGRLKGLRGARLASEIERASRLAGVDEVGERLIRNISRGYQQRCAMAQALLGDPEVLILDEPTAGLDPRQIGEVRALLRELAGAHTVIISTHILAEVVVTCDRAIIINRGKIVADENLRDTDTAALEKTFLTLTEA